MLQLSLEHQKRIDEAYTLLCSVSNEIMVEHNVSRQKAEEAVGLQNFANMLFSRDANAYNLFQKKQPNTIAAVSGEASGKPVGPKKRTFEHNEIKSKCQKKMLKLYQSAVGPTVKRVRYADFRSGKSEVSLVGWPQGIKVASPSKLKLVETHRILEAIEAKKIFFLPAVPQ